MIKLEKQWFRLPTVASARDKGIHMVATGVLVPVPDWSYGNGTCVRGDAWKGRAPSC